MNQSLEEKLKEIFIFHTQMPSSKVIPTATFEELGMDSLDCVEICMDIEDSFDILISDEELNKLNTVQEVYDLVQSKLPEPPAAEDKPKDENTNNN